MTSAAGTLRTAAALIRRHGRSAHGIAEGRASAAMQSGTVRAYVEWNQVAAAVEKLLAARGKTT